MKSLFSILFFLLAFSISAQLSDIEFGSDDKFDLITWNLENFPKKASITKDSVAIIIEAMEADIIALQEIDSKDDFDDLLANLPDYDGFYDPNYFGGLAYIYNESTVEIIDVFEIYTTNSFWNAFPRAPFIIEFKFEGKKMYCINNHLKCCGDGFIENNNDDDEEFRRVKAVKLLKEYIETELDNEHVFLVGDLNDLIAENSSNNVFQSFLDEPNKYAFADLDIAIGSSNNWSFPNWPSHLDHILITNELFNAFDASDTEVRTLKIDDYLIGGLNQYDNTITDHRPVGISLNSAIISSTEKNLLAKTFSIHPNPSNGFTRIKLYEEIDDFTIKIYSSMGQELYNKEQYAGSMEINLNLTDYAPGMYFIQIQGKDQLQVASLIIE